MSDLIYPDKFAHDRDYSHNRTTPTWRLVDPDYGGPHRAGYRIPRSLPPGSPKEWTSEWWAVRTTRTRDPRPRTPRTWTVPQIAAAAGIRPNYVYRWCRRHGLTPYARAGRRLLFAAPDVRRAITRAARRG